MGPITFYTTVNYKSPSKEESFLKSGWGIRDVRGPYLSENIGYIQIPNNLLLADIASTICFTLSLSNRCSVKVIEVQAKSFDKHIIQNIRKNESCDFTFDNVFFDKENTLKIGISISTNSNVRNSQDIDILSIDFLTIERSLIPDHAGEKFL